MCYIAYVIGSFNYSYWKLVKWFWAKQQGNKFVSIFSFPQKSVKTDVRFFLSKMPCILGKIWEDDVFFLILISAQPALFLCSQTTLG